MTTVKILNSYIGVWKPGQIVENAPPELVYLAERGVKNAATGELVAVVIDAQDGVEQVEELKAKIQDAKTIIQNLHRDLAESKKHEADLRVQLDESKKREADLRVQLDELTKPPDGQTGDDLDELKAHAKELKIPGYTKMSADELRAAIGDATGGEGDAE